MDCQPVQLSDADFCYKFTDRMANSLDPDQMASQEGIQSGSTFFFFAIQDNSRFINLHQGTKIDSHSITKGFLVDVES